MTTDLPEAPRSRRPGRTRTIIIVSVVGVLLLVIICYSIYWSQFTMADCAWGTQVAAWIDLNQDGIHDPDEPPLEGVKIFVDDRLNSYQDVGRTQTDYNGQGGVSVWLPGCPDAKFEVRAEVPQGYRLTTQSPVEITGANYGDVERVEFGFAPLAGTVLPTPYVAQLACTRYPDYESYAIVSTPDGLWMSGFQKASRLDPETLQPNLVINYPEQFLYAYSIMPTQHGFWIDEMVNWGYYDGSDWFTQQMDSSTSFIELAPALRQSDDGRIWFSSPEFLISYDPKSGDMQAHVQGRIDADRTGRILIMTYNEDWFAGLAADNADTNRLVDGKWQVVVDKTLKSRDLQSMPSMSSTESGGIVLAPDGSIWFANYSSAFRYVPATGRWLEYEVRDAGSVTFTSISGIAVDPDGNIWMSGGRAVLELTPLSDKTNEAEWRKFDARDGFADGTAERVAVDQDRTIWLVGTYSKGLNKCQLKK